MDYAIYQAEECPPVIHRRRKIDSEKPDAGRSTGRFGRAASENRDKRDCESWIGALHKQLWISGIAIARYMPRTVLVRQVDGMAFFSNEKRHEYLSRVAALRPESTIAGQR
jgi:hypothetical protein